MRLAGIVALILGAAVVLTVLIAHHMLFRRRQPRVSGTVISEGVQAPVRIVRDRHGVPHIEAESMEDATFALGFVHAQDRGWQLELHRRLAAGRVAEFAGVAALEADRFMRRLGLMRVAEEEERLLEPETRRLLDAYSAGVTAVLCGGQPRPPEMVLAGIRPEPWRPAHTLAFFRAFALGLALNWDTELQRLRLLQALGAERAAALDLAYPDANPTILAETLAAAPAPAGSSARAMFEEAARWIPTGSLAAASNNWVVDGSVTETGRPMLCNDPHLTPLVPSIWYEAHVRGGDVEAAGVTVPGSPGVVIGHNRHIAWGFTNSFADVQDLVIEEFGDASAKTVRTETGLQPTLVRDEVITVRGGMSVVERVVETRHGPVVELFSVDGAQRGLALQWPALRPGRSADGFLQLQWAKNWNDFRNALNSVDFAPQNAVYADVDGHIGYFLTSRIPVRRRAASRVPVPGWTGDALFERFLDVAEKPQILDPPDHVIITANNRVVGEGFPHHIAFDYMNGYRAARLQQLLGGRQRMNASFMAATQLDVVCLPARELAVLLADMRCEIREADEARQALVDWDGVMAPESAEPCVYEAFMLRLAQNVLEPLVGESWRLVAGEMAHPVFGVAGNITGRLTPWLLERWRDGDDSALRGRGWDEVAALSMEQAVADVRRSVGPQRRWRWGRLHTMPLVHALGVRRPLGLLFNAGRVEVGGNTDTVLQTAYLPGSYLTRGWAPSWRQIIDVGEWDACTGIHLPGQSGHPGSRHHRDLVQRWRRNQQHPLFWSPDAVSRAAESVLVLRPLPRAVAVPTAEQERVAA
ncbi:MAG TPA: penicillin acylase family protein [Candidatus Dormibacteraeota bacterium]|jgi:penicillin amidase|nr:penicillin acylase family protein [Candidatus Dormibacteraeota bacterium]